jgi:hypothetical protein
MALGLSAWTWSQHVWQSALYTCCGSLVIVSHMDLHSLWFISQGFLTRRASSSMIVAKVPAAVSKVKAERKMIAIFFFIAFTLHLFSQIVK